MPKEDTPCILLYEDEIDAAGPLKDFLELNGYEVFWAQDGAEFQEMLHKVSEKLSLAILDVMAPGLDGYQALEKLRDNPRTRDAPVVFPDCERRRRRRNTGTFARRGRLFAKACQS